MTFALLVVIFSKVQYAETIALGIFLVASLTDYFDGEIARRRKLITNFGILMDPLADKVLICSLFIAFVELQQMEAWMVIIIVARELAITGLRLLAASKNIVLAAEGWGKHKTVSQIVAICAVLVFISYPQWGRWAHAVFDAPLLGHPWVYWLAEISKWLAVILTLVSGSLYLWRNREIYLQES